MVGCLVAFVLAFIVAVIATVVVRAAALRWGVVDKPDHFRKVHQREIPRLGGVAIYVAFVVSLLAMYLFGRDGVALLFEEHSTEMIVLIAGASVTLCFGVADDIWGLSAGWKLLFQTAAASVAIAGGFGIGAVTIPFAHSFHLGFIAIPVTLFWFLGCMNAINLMDGLDGLAAGICLFVSLTLFVVSVLFGNVYTVLLACLSGAIVGFLLFNFHPAKIFLGDTGSMLLGFLVAAISIMAMRKAEAAVALLIPVVALGLPILDTSLAIVRRWSRRLPVSAPDREHIHHVLLSLGLSHKRVVIILYAGCVALCGAAILLNVERSAVATMILGVLLLVAIVWVRVLGGIRFSDLMSRFKWEMERRQKSTEAKIAVEKAIAWMRTASKPAEMWESLFLPLEALGLETATLQLYRDNGTGAVVLTWSVRGKEGDEQNTARADQWSARLQIRSDGRLLAELELSRTIGDTPTLPDAPELIHRLRGELTAQLARMAANGGWR